MEKNQWDVFDQKERMEKYIMRLSTPSVTKLV